MTCKVTPEMAQEARQYDSAESFLRAGGFDVDTLDKAAFGFINGQIIEISPSNLKIKWKDDYLNVLWEIKHSGLSPKQWAKKISLEEPIDISYEKSKFFIEDGHHRYTAAKILKKSLTAKIEIKDRPIDILGAGMKYDDFVRCAWNQSKIIKEQVNYDEKIQPYGLSVMDLLHNVEYDAYDDLYAGYNYTTKDDPENEDKEFYFNSEQDAIDAIQNVFYQFDILPDPIPIYRVMQVKSLDKIDKQDLGASWSFNKDSALNFGDRYNLKDVLLSGTIEKKYVNWESTLKLYIIHSMNMWGEEEDEIVVPNTDHIQNLQITPLSKRIKLTQEQCTMLQESKIEPITLSKIKSDLEKLRADFARVAQEVYDGWEQDEDGHDEQFGYGGICDAIADAITDIIGSKTQYESFTNYDEYEFHTSTYVYHCYDEEMDENEFEKRAYMISVDIPYWIYESGAAYTWTKKQGVHFSADMVEITDMSSYAENFIDFETCEPI